MKLDLILNIVLIFVIMLPKVISKNPMSSHKPLSHTENNNIAFSLRVVFTFSFEIFLFLIISITLKTLFLTY